MTERPEREHQRRLLPETQRLLRSIEERTGRPVVIRAEPAIRERGRAIYVVSDPNPDRHLVLFDPQHTRFLDHLVAHEAGHIRRFAEADAGARVIPATTQETRLAASRQLAPELLRLLAAGLPPRALQEVLPIWLSGTVAQLSDTPSDINIERLIHVELPTLRRVQEASLLDQVRTLRMVASPAVRAVTPESVWVASNAMNYTLVRTVASMLSRPDLLRPYKNTRAERLGYRLLDIFAAELDGSFASERRVTDRWAAELGFSRWFEWRSLDALPPGFRHAWE